MPPVCIFKVSSLTKEDVMNLKTLAEAIMLQAADDFLGENRCEEDVAFFSGEGFRICSAMAGMKYPEKCELLDLVRKCAPVSYPEMKRVAAVGSMRSLHI
jgi:hypothetical protein